MKYSLSGVSVYIACPVNREFPWQTTKSFMETVSMLTARGIEYEVQFLTNGSLIDKARSHLAHFFLKGKMSRLFWIDSDMSWEAESFLRILSMSTAMDIVGATYPAKRGPNIEFMMDVEPGPVSTNEHGCIPVKGMGLGFTCCRREVIEHLAKHAPKVRDEGEDIAMMFRTEFKAGVYRGEDMVFFDDCRKAGAGVWCDPSIELGHVGAKEYKGALKGAMREAS